MNVLIVQVTHIGQETTRTDRESPRHGQGLNEGFFQAQLSFPLVHLNYRGQFTVKHIVDIGTHGNLGVP